MQDLWALARIDLGLSDAEFGALTPKLFDALVKRKQAQDRKEDIRAGVVAAAVANHSMVRPPDKWYTAADFFTSLHEEQESQKTGFDLRDLSPEEQADFVRKQFGKKIYTRK